MTKDYVLFIHGVNTRRELNRDDYADKIFERIQNEVEIERLKIPSLKIQLKKAPLYWGETAKIAEEDLLKDFEKSEVFKKHLWFKNFRKKQLLQFAGDIAIYFENEASAYIIKKLKNDAQMFLVDYREGDRLHLVTHSWGTVILFDILFSYRWHDEHLDGYEDVQFIRESLHGIAPNKNRGFYLSSIHTMGSPIALYILVLLNNKSSKLSFELIELSKYIHEQSLNKQGLLWQNFIHPGDPIAWPLEETISRFMRRLSLKSPNIRDIVIPHNAGIKDFLTQFVSQTLVAFLNGGNAHSSYWQSQEVSQMIAKSIFSIANEEATHSSRNSI